MVEIKSPEVYGGTVIIKNNFSVGGHRGEQYRLDNWVYLSASKSGIRSTVAVSLDNARLLRDELNSIIEQADKETAEIEAAKSKGKFRVKNLPDDKVGNASVVRYSKVVAFDLPWDVAEGLAAQLNARED